MRRMFAAISFLTRFPVPRRFALDGAELGRSTLYFPVVGALLGSVQAGVLCLLSGRTPPVLTAVLIVACSALMTGALHLDGLADTADGFGGGRKRDDVLRIMRDHAIGTYGAVALLFVLMVKISALSTLVERGRANQALVLAAALGRWTPVSLGHFLPYARAEGGLGAAMSVGKRELLGASAIVLALATWLSGIDAVYFLSVIVALAAAWGIWCTRRIGGNTGDTLGAAVEAGEALIYLVAVMLH